MRTAVTLSLNINNVHTPEIDHLGNKVVERGRGVIPPSPPPLSTAGLWTEISRLYEQIFLHLGYLLYANKVSCLMSIQ
jgi:hypothetical protein